MRVSLFRQTSWRGLLTVAGALLISACDYPHPGPAVPSDGVLPAGSGAASVTSMPTAAKPVASNTVPSSPTTEPESLSFPERSESSAPAPAEVPDASMAAAGDSGPVTDGGLSFDNLDVLDGSLNGKLEILRVGSEPTANNLLSVFAGLKNKTSENLYLDVQTVYKDKSGNSLNRGSWVPMMLKPHAETEYRSASISEAAVDFVVRIRRGTSDEQD